MSKLKYTEQLKNMIKLGLDGKNKGIPTGFPKLDKHIFGIQKKFLTVIGGDSGSGKSSLALYMYVYRPIMEAQRGGINLNILYFSFEMSSEILLAKLLSIYILENYRATVSFAEILSFDTKLEKEKYDYVAGALSWLESVEDYITIIDKPVTPKGVYAITKEWTEKYGKFTDINERRTIYESYKENHFLIGVIDHIRLLAGNDSTKAKIDECCDYAVSLRNQTGMTWCIVQQLNRGFKSMERRREDTMIQLDDFADSSSPCQSAEVVLGIFDAYREKRRLCEGYQVDKLKDSFRMLNLLKNRFGNSNKNDGLFFDGATGYWEELPLPMQINYEQYVKK